MSLVFDYIVSLTNLYGLVHKEKVAEIYNMQNEAKVDNEAIESIMLNNQRELEGHFVYIDGAYFIHEVIMDDDEFDNYMEQKKGKPYYIPNKKELLKYKDEGYFEKTFAYYRLHSFVKKRRQLDNVNSVEDICRDVVLHCEDEVNTLDIIADMDRVGIECTSESDISEAVNLITELGNNTRLWVNNGYTPEEMFEKFERPHLQPLPEGTLRNLDSSGDKPPKGNPAERVIKVGRNDLCPCGSGKKYKKCCL